MTPSTAAVALHREGVPFGTICKALSLSSYELDRILRTWRLGR